MRDDNGQLQQEQDEYQQWLDDPVAQLEYNEWLDSINAAHQAVGATDCITE